MTGVKGKSILVVDDDAAMLRALGKVLSGEGAMVSKASSAREALGQLADKARRFDLVITDLCMPVLGGKSVLEFVTVALSHVPVIIITAFGSLELRAECLRQGAAAFLEKPVDAVTLLAAIESVLSSPTDKAQSHIEPKKREKGERINI